MTLHSQRCAVSMRGEETSLHYRTPSYIAEDPLPAVISYSWQSPSCVHSYSQSHSLECEPPLPSFTYSPSRSPDADAESVAWTRRASNASDYLDAASSLSRCASAPAAVTAGCTTSVGDCCEPSVAWTATYSKYGTMDNGTTVLSVDLRPASLTLEMECDDCLETTLSPQNHNKFGLTLKFGSADSLTRKAESDDIDSGIQSPQNHNQFGLTLQCGSAESPTRADTDNVCTKNPLPFMTELKLRSVNCTIDENVEFATATGRSRRRSHRKGQKSFDVSENGTLVAGDFQITAAGVRRASMMTKDSEHTSFGREISFADLVRVADLGSGATGTVAKSLHLPTLSLVAVKTLSVYDKDQRRQMIKELSGFSLSAHQNILGFVGACFNEGSCAMVLELCNRGSLESLTEKHGALKNERQLRFVVRQMVSGLAHLASLKCIHRDIKPANILVHADGAVKLGDFGLLRQLDGTKDLAQTFTGTLSYLAPERVTGDAYSCVSDIWSFGMTLIYCVRGELGFPTDYWSVLSLLHQEPPRLTPEADEVSAEFCDFVDKCMQKDPGLRWSASKLATHPFLSAHSDHDDSSDPTLLAGEDDAAGNCLPGSWPISRAKPPAQSELHLIACALIDRFYTGTALKYASNSLDQQRFRDIAQQLGCEPTTVQHAFEHEWEKRINGKPVTLGISPSISAAAVPKELSLSKTATSALSMSQQIRTAMLAATQSDIGDLYSDDCDLEESP